MTFKDKTQALLDLRREVNAMSQAFVIQLGLKIQKTNIGAKKIDDTILKTHKMVVSTFFILNKDDKKRFLKESFSLINIKPDIVFGISFLTISNADVDF